MDKDEWTRASDEHRFFRYGRLVGTPAEFQFSNNSKESRSGLVPQPVKRTRQTRYPEDSFLCPADALVLP